MIDSLGYESAVVVGWAPPIKRAKFIDKNAMTNYRRLRKKGGVYFFTLVTRERKPILISDDGRRRLREAIEETRNFYPFDIEAWVSLPDHIHCVWKLPEDDDNFSKRWGMIKGRFSRKTRGALSQESDLSPSMKKKREAGIWQRRFWERLIRDERDFNRHADYIHYNPVKHGLVKKVKDWPYSSFHRYVRMGKYDPDWGDFESDLEYE